MGKYKRAATRVIIIFVCMNFMWSCSQLAVKATDTERTEVTSEKHEYSLEIMIIGDNTYTEEEIRYIMNHDNSDIKSLQKNDITKGSSFLCTLIPKNDQSWRLNQQKPQVTYFIRSPFSRFLRVSWEKPEKEPADKEDNQRVKGPINGDLNKNKSIAGEESRIIKDSSKDSRRLIVTSKEVGFCIDGVDDTQIKELMFVDLYGETIAPAKFSVRDNGFREVLSAIKNVSEQSNGEFPISDYYVEVKQPACNKLFTFNYDDIIEKNPTNVNIRLNPYKIGIRIPSSIDMKTLESKCPDLSSRMENLGNDFIVEVSEVPERNDSGTFNLECCDGELILRKERGNIENLDIHFLLDCITTKSKPYNVVFKFFDMSFMAKQKQQIYLPVGLQLYGNKGGLLALNKDSMDYWLPYKKNYNRYDIESINDLVKGHYCAGDENFRVVFDTHKEIESQSTIELHYFLRNRLKRVLFIYYPLQYSTSYRSKIIDDNSEIAFKMDAGLRTFITDIYTKEIYDDIYVRFARDKTVSIFQTGMTGINEFLFLDRDIYDAPEYLWSEGLLGNDYKHKNMHHTTAYVDILYFGSIPNTSRIIDKFKDMKNASIYFINFIDKDWEKEIKERDLRNLGMLHHAPVAIHLPAMTEKFGESFKGAFDYNRIVTFFNKIK